MIFPVFKKNMYTKKKTEKASEVYLKVNKYE